MTQRKHVSSGAPWEAIVGYSRAVRVGDHIVVAGTIATDSDGNAIAPGDAYAQTKAAIATIGAALEELGASFTDVVRTRTFITDLDQWEAFGRAHGEVFAEIRPASTLVGVSGLINPDCVVEIEVDAIVTTD